MTKPVIEINGLSKAYRLGHIERYPTFRETITRAVTAPIRRFRELSGRCDSRTHETFWALKDVSFDVQPREVVGIIGRNGAGKSTLLKILSRITEPTAGYARIRGRVGSLLEVGTGFHPELTGRENIYLNGSILGMRKTEIDSKLDEIVAFAEIEKFLDTPVKYYSSGMYVRLAFSVAAHLEPEILIIDEVLAVGDMAFQRKCLGKMGDVSKHGRTVLFVSHNMAAVEKLCTRAILLCDGRIRDAGEVASTVASYVASCEQPVLRSGGPLAISPDGGIEVLSLGAVDEDLRSLPAGQCGRDLILALRLRVKEYLRAVTITLGFDNAFDARATLIHSGIAGLMIDLEPGEHEVLCRISDLSLMPGGYFLDLTIVNNNNEIVLSAPRVVVLSVIAGDFHGTGRLPDPNWAGVFQMRQHWDVHRIDPAAPAPVVQPVES